MLVENLLSKLDSGFELLPSIESLTAPLLEKELRDLADRVPRELVRLPGPYADLVREPTDLAPRLARAEGCVL